MYQLFGTQKLNFILHAIINKSDIKC